MFFKKIQINPKFLDEYRKNFKVMTDNKKLICELGLDKIKEIFSVERIGSQYYVKYLNNNSSRNQIILNKNYVFYHPPIINWQEPVFIEEQLEIKNNDLLKDIKYYDNRVRYLLKELLEVVPINELKQIVYMVNETCTKLDYINKIKLKEDQGYLKIQQMTVQSDWDENIEFIINQLLDILTEKPVELLKKCQ